MTQKELSEQIKSTLAEIQSKFSVQYKAKQEEEELRKKLFELEKQRFPPEMQVFGVTVLKVKGYKEWSDEKRHILVRFDDFKETWFLSVSFEKAHFSSHSRQTLEECIEDVKAVFATVSDFYNKGVLP